MGARPVPQSVHGRRGGQTAFLNGARGGGGEEATPPLGARGGEGSLTTPPICTCGGGGVGPPLDWHRWGGGAGCQPPSRAVKLGGRAGWRSAPLSSPVLVGTVRPLGTLWGGSTGGFNPLLGRAVPGQPRGAITPPLSRLERGDATPRPEWARPPTVGRGAWGGGTRVLGGGVSPI